MDSNLRARHNVGMTFQKLFSALLIGTVAIAHTNTGHACTGITLAPKDKSVVVARTIEWSGSEMTSQYVIVPQGYTQKSFVPGGQKDGLEFSALYGYVGLAVEEPEYVVEGLNEAGLSAGLFYFPGYGQYQAYDPADNAETISDFQLVSWILSRFSTIDQVQEAIKDVRVVGIDPRSSTVHWRIADFTGRQVVLEITGGVPHFYENTLGVLTNAPGFEWQMTNLNNYVNLAPGTAGPTNIRNLHMTAFGGGSGMLGLPGDATPPSRFVRAAFYAATAVPQNTAYGAVMQAFHILNNFDIPVGIQYPIDQVPTPMPSATQFTAVTDMTNRILYYRTMYNSVIRAIDLSKIDFGDVTYQTHPLDAIREQTVIQITPDA